MQQPTRHKLFEGRSDRLLFKLSFVALGISACTATGLLDRFDNLPPIRLCTELIPGIDWVARQTDYPRTARVTFAVQWLFAPVYLFLLCGFRKPWVAPRAKSATDRADLRSRAKRALPCTLIFLWMILADWQIVLGPSLFRGTLWEPEFSLTTLPYVGRPGLAVAAFLTPVVQCWVYWFVALISSHYFVASFLAVRAAPSRSAP
jgi:hypothetical protein